MLWLASAAGCEALRGPRSESAAASGDFITTVYLTESQALAVVFPEATRVVEDKLILSPQERSRAQELLGRPLLQRAYRAYVGFGADGTLDGYAVIQDEIGKFKPFTFVVGVEPSGRVRRVAVLVYREARGAEVASRRFLLQYPGKTLDDPLDKNRDIINIQGATMSVDSLNHGVRKVLAVVETAYRRQPRRVEALAGRRGRSVSRTDSVGASAFKEHTGSNDESREVREARYIMGSLCEIRAIGSDEQRLRQAVSAAFDEVEAIDRALSDYRSDSELSRLNRDAWRQALPLSARTSEFLFAAERLAVDTEGAFDLTVGPLVDAWGFRSGKHRVPSEHELRRLASLVGPDRMLLRRQPGAPSTLHLAAPGVRLDPGGLGKGFAVDRCVRVLERHGVESALVDFSSTVYALGTPRDGESWSVAVRDPARPSTLLGRVPLRDAALAASGSAEKSFSVAGVRYCHILSPLTLHPVMNVAGAVVIAPTATAADGLATAACVLGTRAVPILERQGAEGLVVLTEGTREFRHRATRGWRTRPLDGDEDGPAPAGAARVLLTGEHK